MPFFCCDCSVDYFCPICHDICRDKCIFCSLCEKFLHIKCTKLTRGQVRSYARCGNYICNICLKDNLPVNKMFPDLKYPVQVSHIDDAHPLRTRSGEKVFIVKFGPRWMKNEIYKRRAQLKTSAYKHISITEQLTKHTQSLLDQTRTVVGQDVKVFTNNCVISTKFLNRKYRVKTYKDLQFLAKKVGYKHPLTPPGFQASPVYQVNPHGSAPQHDYDAGLVNTAAAYNMHPIDPYAYVPPPGGRGNGGAWSAANT